MTEPTTYWRMPEETCKHKRTWMAFGASEDLWGNKLDDVRACIAHLARTISRFEPVTMLVRPEEKEIAARLCGDGVELVEAELDDIWIRDTGPLFVRDEDNRMGAVNLNFNGWGRKQRYRHDAKVAKLVAEKTGAVHLKAGFIGEGGGIEVDGEGTAIITESCILNDNRNPSLTKQETEVELKRLLGLKKVIWLPGIAGKDITDSHTDFYARFPRPGVVAVYIESDPRSFDFKATRQNLEILKGSTDAKGRNLEVVAVGSPLRPRNALLTKDDSALGYLNYYIVNGAVIVPEFGDLEADEKCRTTLARLFPDREIVQLDIDPIAWGGGGIHCVTLGEPLPKEERDPL